MQKALSATGDLVDGDHPTKSVLRLLGQRRARVAAAIGFFALKDTPLWLLPAVTAQVIDVVVDGGPWSGLWIWTVVGVVALLQNYPNHVMYTRLFMGVVRDTGAGLRNALTQRLNALSIGFHARASSSVVQTKLVRDVENIEVMLQQIAHPLLSAVMVLGGAITLTALNVPWFLPVYALTVPLAVLLRWAIGRASARRNAEFRTEVERLAARVGEMATLMPVTRAHGLEHTAAERVRHGAEGVRAAGYSLDLLNGRFASVSWVSLQLMGLGCLVIAAAVTLSGTADITPGQVVLLSTYFAQLTNSVTQLLMLLPVGARGLESVRSIAEVLQEPDLEQNEGGTEVQSVRGDLRFEHVSFRYPDARGAAIDDVDLDVPAGTTVAFVGSSGSGKSTMVNLALGFLRPTGGRMTLDGVDLEQLDMRTARRWFSVVPQESVLFEGSIRENVTYGLGEVDDDRVRDALEAANVRTLVDELPDGWHTLVGERGARLSGGQRQRLAIARALIRDPQVLLLDEPTSALDPESEELVRDALARLMRGRTTLVVAHRLSTIRSADLIVVLERGRIVERGSHDELLALGARYARLHAAQAH